VSISPFLFTGPFILIPISLKSLKNYANNFKLSGDSKSTINSGTPLIVLIPPVGNGIVLNIVPKYLS
jgi:hypothetical protein